jgi:plasmid stability protein
MPDSSVALQIRHVPPDVHAILRRRAAAEGKSLQEYLLALLVAQASKPTRHEVLSGAARHASGHVGLQEAADVLREGRDER